ncbi:bifunctional peptidase and (3S)-lysyl hydroxylase JMJD7-like [Acropora millepora]|uniref:bifunctional peptidase and (3S)-lysyl hydroxylase JMJD7-like n=1 Tax=Acropora millepora TaxID=45264 RepID=UPI001CF56839|nr:bifunctional peptidase and (3S)-lysyl hydroxylase JMJD7-like [Acropora millepora]
MAYVLRVLRNSPLFIFCFSTVLTLLTSIRPALSEGLDEYSLLNITDQVSNSCILLGLQPADSAALVTILRQLSHAFKGEKLVNIGVLKEEYLSMISWKSGNTLDLAEKNDLAFYRRKKIDRTCLMKPQWKNPPTAERYLGLRTTEKLVEFLNTNCASYRLLDGGLSVAGLRREKILRNLYRVPNSLDTNSINGPINIADKCERISMPSKEKFIEEYYFRSKPVVITGALKHWPAVTKWTSKFLTERFGSKKVRVAFAPNGEYEGCEKASNFDNFKEFKFPEEVKSQLPFLDLVVVRPAFLEVPFSTFMEMLQSSNNTDISAYLEYSSIPSLLPELELDIREMPFIYGELKRRHLNIWLSNGNTLGKLHYDPFDNFLCQISGRKELFLYEPHQNSRLYEAHIQEASLAYNPVTKKFWRKELLESTSMVMSPVDILKPDYNRFPKFKEAQALNCTINEGDVLFMPSFWWHEVQSYPSENEPRNLAVNFWYEPFLTKEFPCATCKMEINDYYRHMLET